MENCECESCGKKFKSEVYNRYCPKCLRQKGTDRYMNIAIFSRINRWYSFGKCV